MSNDDLKQEVTDLKDTVATLITEVRQMNEEVKLMRYDALVYYEALKEDVDATQQRQRDKLERTQKLFLEGSEMLPYVLQN